VRVLGGIIAGHRRVNRRPRLRVPRLAGAPLSVRDQLIGGDRHPDRVQRGGHQDQLFNQVGVTGRVQHGQVASGGMAEQPGLVQPEVHAERLDVLHHAIAPVGRGVGRHRGGTGTAQFKEDQLAAAQAAEIAEVVGDAPWAAGQA
jgi:hypothetical protein